MRNGVRKGARKGRKSRREIERSVRVFWGGVLLVGLFAVLLMHAALA